MITPIDFARQLLVVLLPTVMLILWRRGVRGTRLFALVLLSIYAVGAASLTLAPIPVDGTLIGELRQEVSVQHNLVPLRTLGLVLSGQSFSVQLREIGGNLALLFPLGLLVPALFPKLRGWRATMGVVFGVSLGIELLQWLGSLGLGFVWKTLDVDDLLLNTISGALGWLAFRSLVHLLGPRAFEAFAPRMRRHQGQPAHHR